MGSENQFSFEHLEIWQLAKKFAIDIYKVFNEFPSTEKFGLTSQLGRSCISISSNIAEGTSRKSRKEQSHFIEIAYGSLLETISGLTIAKELGYLNKEEFSKIKTLAIEISHKLSAYRNYLLKDL